MLAWHFLALCVKTCGVKYVLVRSTVCVNWQFEGFSAVSGGFQSRYPIFSPHFFFFFLVASWLGWATIFFSFFLLPQCLASICSLFIYLFFIQLLDSTQWIWFPWLSIFCTLLVTDSLSTSLYLYFENISLANKKMKQTTVYNKVNS